MNDELIESGRKPLIDLGTCNIHTVHNAFLKGLNALGENVSDFVYQIHHFFDGWPARWEEFEDVQEKVKVPKHRFVKHVASRWLTLEAAAERVLEQWPAVLEYFTKHLPKSSNLPSSLNFKNITSFLKRSTARLEVMFIAKSAALFSSLCTPNSLNS